MAESEPIDVRRQARRLIEQSDFAGAESVLRAALGRGAPGDDEPDLLYLLAVSQRYQQKLDQAARTLDSLLDVRPELARAWQEKGHVALSKNQLPQACSAYQEAVRRNPALLASWKALANLYQMSGQPDQSAIARAEAEYLATLPAELQGVLSFVSEGKLAKADQLCRSFLRGHKQHLEGMRLLAMIGEQLGVLTDAEFLLETALELEPGFLRARYDYANLLLKMQKFEKALAQTRTLVEAAPDNLRFLSLHGNALAGVGDSQGAIDAYNRVIDARPGQFVLHVMRGHAEKTIGRLDDAVASYRAAYRIEPRYGDAFWSLANTKTYVFTDEEIEHMLREEAGDAIGADDRIHMCFALGKAFEDRGDYERSFACYDRGNRLKREATGYRLELPARRVKAQKEVCTREFFSDRQDVGAPEPDPIFIVGLPRAGSTLLEQILASHSMVDGTLELPNIIALTQRLARPVGSSPDGGAAPRYPQILSELDADYFRRFGEQFLEETRVYRQGAPFFIDKNPNNFFHVGLIRLILPNAKVIDARRHPLACCVSGFKQLFGQGQDFSYGLREIGSYYRAYVELMDHWDSVLPGFVLRVQHEQVVEDLEGQVRRMLEFCGLSFEQACLEFHRTERSVRTPSSEQVRQPIYTSGIDAWRNFEPWLDPLKDALGEEIRAAWSIT